MHDVCQSTVCRARLSRGFYFGCKVKHLLSCSASTGSARRVIIALVYSVNVCQMDTAASANARGGKGPPREHRKEKGGSTLISSFSSTSTISTCWHLMQGNSLTLAELPSLIILSSCLCVKVNRHRNWVGEKTTDYQRMDNSLKRFRVAGPRELCPARLRTHHQALMMTGIILKECRTLFSGLEKKLLWGTFTSNITCWKPLITEMLLTPNKKLDESWSTVSKYNTELHVPMCF